MIPNTGFSVANGPIGFNPYPYPNKSRPAQDQASPCKRSRYRCHGQSRRRNLHAKRTWRRPTDWSTPSSDLLIWFPTSEECGYGSIPINTIFRGMNIHLPAILMFTRGTRFWHTAMSWMSNPQIQIVKPWVFISSQAVSRSKGGRKELQQAMNTYQLSTRLQNHPGTSTPEPTNAAGEKNIFRSRDQITNAADDGFHDQGNHTTHDVAILLGSMPYASNNGFHGVDSSNHHGAKTNAAEGCNCRHMQALEQGCLILLKVPSTEDTAVGHVGNVPDHATAPQEYKEKEIDCTAVPIWWLSWHATCALDIIS